MDISRLAVTYENYDLLPLLLAMLLVEATTGNKTGTRLAFIGAVKGCKVILISPASLTDPAKGY
jgi:threonine synthase